MFLSIFKFPLFQAFWPPTPFPVHYMINKFLGSAGSFATRFFAYWSGLGFNVALATITINLSIASYFIHNPLQWYQCCKIFSLCNGTICFKFLNSGNRSMFPYSLKIWHLSQNISKEQKGPCVGAYAYLFSFWGTKKQLHKPRQFWRSFPSATVIIPFVGLADQISQNRTDPLAGSCDWNCGSYR